MPEYFNLQEGETIIREIKPKSSLKWYFFITGGVFSILLAPGVFFVYLFLNLSTPITFFKNIWIIIIVSILTLIVLDLIFSMLRYNKQYYWITNNRIIYKRGLIGYRITSIPLERISDVIISRTFLEKLFGFGSLHIQSLAGQVSGTHSLGAEGVLLAIPDPEETQELIFKLIKTKRVKERLAF